MNVIGAQRGEHDSQSDGGDEQGVLHAPSIVTSALVTSNEKSRAIAA
jgi:hypothetical protein